MSRNISESLRQFVAQRANYCCEYCQMAQVVRFVIFHVEHVRSMKHGGQTVEHNLAFSCPECNFQKGSDLGTFIDDDNLVRFFNPRKDVWDDHFEIENGVIFSKTDIGEATVRILKFNIPERIIFRKEVLKT